MKRLIFLPWYIVMTLTGWKRKAVSALVLMIFVLLLPHADANGDKAETRIPAEVVPLRSLLERVHQRHPGRILEVELEQEEDIGAGVWIYEVKMLTRRGRVYELEYDAVTLELLKTEGAPYCSQKLNGEESDESACRRR